MQLPELLLKPEAGFKSPADPDRVVVQDATGHAAQQLGRVLAEIARRSIESLNLYEPLPEQDAFHKCRSLERLLVGSNRGGKTLPAAVEVARAVCGCDPFDKYPKKDGICYAVGKDAKHLGAVMWRKLGRAGAFQIIRDRDTGLWRAFRPWESRDAARSFEAKPAPPLIPPRMISRISWDKKAESIPSVVKLVTGWEIHFLTSKGDPSQGTAINLAWFDEELENEEWYAETAARLVDKRGLFMWSVTPQVGTQSLYDLHERALRQKICEHPSIAEFSIYLSDNRHLTEQQKRDFADKFVNDETVRVRIGGEWAIHSRKVFPEYTELKHEIAPFSIPDSWTRYVAVDPGRQICAALFLAVPPPGDGKHTGRCYLYDEIYIADADADQFGNEMRKKCSGQLIRAFLIDGHMGRQTEMGIGLTVEEQYSQALRRYGVRSQDTGSGFIWGSDNVDARLLAVRDWLRMGEQGTPRLQIFSTLENFRAEIKRYQKRQVAGRLTDKPDPKTPGHLMDCLGYLVMYNPRYYDPPPVKRENYVMRALREKEERKALKEGRTSIRLGPGRRRAL